MERLIETMKLFVIIVMGSFVASALITFAMLGIALVCFILFGLPLLMGLYFIKSGEVVVGLCIIVLFCYLYFRDENY